MEKKYLVLSDKIGEYFETEEEAQARAKELAELLPGWTFYFCQMPKTFECKAPEPKFA